MIYLTGDVSVVVLETANLLEIRKGHPAKTPDNSAIIAWTPDIQWLTEELVKYDGDAQMIGRLIDVAAKRPEKDNSAAQELDSLLGLGATGNFSPEGKVNECDEGELLAALGFENGKLVLRFGKSLRWVAMSKDQALTLGNLLIAKANKM